MTNEEIRIKIEKWQNADFVHPLTCGHNSSHRILEAKVLKDAVVLVCLDCEYVQEYIPPMVLGTYVQDMEEYARKAAKK